MVKFKEDVCKLLCDARSSGLIEEECAQLAGIHPSTLYRWLDRGANAKSGKYRKFFIDFMQANIEFRRYHRDKIAENKDWRASQYLLMVNEFGKYNVTQKVESKVEAEVKAEVRLSDLFDDEILDDILDEDDNEGDDELYDIE